jgi:RNA 3'-phosphate cyclase
VAVEELCNAETDGVYPGSTDLVFKPGQLTGGDYVFDVGTAGSISLILQSCLIPATLSKARIRLTVRGGTDVKWSPPIDYMRLVHLPILSRFGPQSYLEIASRGFYPEGGGEVSLELDPIGGLNAVDLSKRGSEQGIDGVAFSQNLPDHVVTRMKHASLKRLIGHREVRIESDIRRGVSTGAGLVLAATFENTVLGASSLGARGVRAETLGEDCARDLLETIGAGATVDQHMTDQILPYMALAKGTSSILTEEISGHAETNIWVIERFMGKRFSVSKRESLVEVCTV